MSKGVIFILLGLFIDGAQAFMSLALATIAAFPGTVGGAAGGCAIGSYFLGKIGCWAGGVLLGTFGSIPFVNALLATVTEPIGIMLGIVISMCLSVTLGVFLIAIMAFGGIFYPKYIIWGGGELIPGLNVIPFWTTFAILCVLKKKGEEGKGSVSIAARIVSSLTSPQSAASAALGTAAAGASAMHTSENEPRAQAPLERPENTYQEPAARAPSLPLSRTMDTDIKPASAPTAANDNSKTARAANDNLIDVDGHGRTAYAA